jgi:small subunit ribosomal protein S18
MKTQRRRKIQNRDNSRAEKGCAFCKSKAVPRWEDSEKLREYLSVRGRILGSNISGVCVKHQRQLARAIKQARHLALLPFSASE